MSESDSSPISRRTIEDLTRGLDPVQSRAVTTSAPLLAVIAGAGSGKTRVLTRRVAYRCATDAQDASHVVVLTFTRQAATELRRRLWALGVRDGVMAGTFHAIAYSLLRQWWDDQGRRHPVLVQDRRRLIGEVLGPRSSADLATIATEVDWARARNLIPQQYAAARDLVGRRSPASATDVARVMNDLTILKRKRGIIDLDDLLSLSIEALQSDAQFAASTRWRLRHFYVDETQDLNPLQIALLAAWRNDREDLTIVGDPSQAIFGFNGADARLLDDLETRFPGIEVVRLTTNYRCTPQIVAAGLVALGNGSMAPPDLHSARPDGQPVEIFGFDDERNEAQGVARLVGAIRDRDRPFGDMAILARTNAQLPPIAAALDEAGIPARLVTNQTNDPLRRVLREVEDLPSASRLAMWSKDVSSRLVDTGGTAVTIDVPQSFVDATEVETDDHDIRLRVARVVDEFLSDGGGDGRTFGAWVRANRPFDTTENPERVELITFHAAKGREWDQVIVVGCEKGLLPHSSAQTPAENDEEVRLTYVALTRAADRLFLTYARNRRGRRRERSPLILGTDRREPNVAPDDDLSREFRHRRATLLPPDPIWEALLQWRETAGRAAAIEPRVLCPDDVLRRIADEAPVSEQELAAITGVGPLLARRSGTRILEAVRIGSHRRFADAPD